MKVQIVISIGLITGAIFYKYLRKLPSRGDGWDIDNEKVEKILAIIARIIMFLLGVFGLVHALFFAK